MILDPNMATMRCQSCVHHQAPQKPKPDWELGFTCLHTGEQLCLVKDIEPISRCNDWLPGEDRSRVDYGFCPRCGAAKQALYRVTAGQHVHAEHWCSTCVLGQAHWCAWDQEFHDSYDCQCEHCNCRKAANESGHAFEERKEKVPEELQRKQEMTNEERQEALRDFYESIAVRPGVDLGDGFDLVENLKLNAERIRQSIKRSVQEVLEIGRCLNAVKQALEHGSFTRWIELEFGMNIRTAQRMMSAYETFGKNDIMSFLPDKPTVLYELVGVEEETRKALTSGESVTIDGREYVLDEMTVDLVKRLKGQAEEAEQFAQRKFEDARRNQAEVRELNKALKEKQREYDRELTKRIEALQESQQKLKEVEAHLSSQKEQLELADQVNLDDPKVREAVQQRAEALAEQTLQGAREKFGEMQAQLKSKSTHVQNLEQELARISESLENSRQAQTNAADTIDELNAEIARLKQQGTEITPEVLAEDPNVRKLVEQLAEQQAAGAKQRIALLEDQFKTTRDELKAAIEKKEAERQELEARLAQVRKSSGGPPQDEAKLEQWVMTRVLIEDELHSLLWQSLRPDTLVGQLSEEGELNDASRELLVSALELVGNWSRAMRRALGLPVAEHRQDNL